MRRFASTVTLSVTAARAAVDDRGQLREPRLEQVVLDTEVAHGLDEGRVGDADARQRQARLGLIGRGAGRLDEERGDGVGRLLVELVDGADRGGDVGDAEAAVEALDQLAVVDLERQRRQRKGGEGLDHHPHHLDVVVERQLVAAHDVDVGLVELAVAAFLRPLAAPGRLDLVAAEGELQLAGVLQDVAGERHGQVVVQAQLSTCPQSPALCHRGRRAGGAGRRAPCRSRRPWTGGRGARRRGSRCWRTRAARRCATTTRSPRARRPSRQAGTRGSRSAAWAWTTGFTVLG